MSQNSINKIEQLLLVDYFAKYTLELKDEKIFFVYKNIFKEFNKNWPLQKIDPNYSILKQSFDKWENVAWFFVALAFFYSILKSVFNTSHMVNAVVIFSLLFIALIFALFKLKKYEYIYFSDYNNNYLFGIRLTPKTKVQKQKFIDNLVNAI